MPGARSRLGGRVPEHAGGPQLPARGQRQLSGGTGAAFARSPPDRGGGGTEGSPKGVLPQSPEVFGNVTNGETKAVSTIHISGASCLCCHG